MKYLKYYENEFTRLAANMYISKLHNDYKFTNPTDNQPINFCKITFPDNAEIIFNCVENLNSDVATLKLIKSNDVLMKPYIDLYGDIIQFDDYNSFKMIRLYTNFEDLLDTHFDGYIINDKSLGASDIGIDIIKDSISGSSKILGIFTDQYTQRLTLLNCINFLKNKPNWRTYFVEEKQELLMDYLEILNDLENNGNYNINISNITSKQVNLNTYLYLYYITISNNGDIEKIFKNPIKVNIDFLIYVLTSL